jgi:hypothetical protein
MMTRLSRIKIIWLAYVGCQLVNSWLSLVRNWASLLSSKESKVISLSLPEHYILWQWKPHLPNQRMMLLISKQLTKISYSMIRTPFYRKNLYVSRNRKCKKQRMQTDWWLRICREPTWLQCQMLFHKGMESIGLLRWATKRLKKTLKISKKVANSWRIQWDMTVKCLIIESHKDTF